MSDVGVQSSATAGSQAAADDNTVVASGRFIRPPTAFSGVAVRVVAWCATYGAVLSVLLYVGRHIRLLDDKIGSSDVGSGLAPALRALLGRPDRRDFFVDYASSHALTHHKDAYDISAHLFRGLGPAWAVNGPNPHPPTLLILVLPFVLLSYGPALAGWALAMVGVFIATLRLVGVPLRYALAIGVGLAITFPGAYGIVNVEPVIGLGIALAYRYRDSPIIAGLGIALAALPKGSGLVLAVPFLLAARLRTVVYAALFYAGAALVPVFWQSNIWGRYLDVGLKSVHANAYLRADNASLLYLSHSLWGLSYTATAFLIVLITIGLVLAQRDLFWPTAWASVAVLPIGWMYSLLALVPLIAFAVLQAPRRTAGLALVATGVALGTPPFGRWPTVWYPVVVGTVAAMYLCMRPKQSILWLPPQLDRLLPKRLQLTPRTEPA